MKIGGLILGQGINRIVRDGRTLRGMEKSGHFIEPIVGSFPQVDNTGLPRSFIWHGENYDIGYFDGSMFPFVLSQ